MGHVLEVDNVVKQYGKSKKDSGAATLALAGASFFVDAGEFVAIMGPSGVGQIDAAQLHLDDRCPDLGSIRVAGRDVTKMRGESSRNSAATNSALYFKTRICSIPSPCARISLALTIQKKTDERGYLMVNEIATRLGIADFEQYPYQISGGQKQRAAAARAVITKPSLILADEPTGALDSKSSKQLLETFSTLNRMGSTLVMVTHDAFAASWCSRIIFIRDGALYGQIQRGALNRTQFFETIVAATTQMESEAANAR